VADPALVEGLRSQLQAREGALAGGAEHRGWKAGFGTAAAKELLGTGGPLVGYLTEATLLESGAAVDVSGWGKAVLEPEAALLLDADIAGDADAEAAAASVGAVAAAIELVDLGEAGGDPGLILAANVFHRHYLLGDPAPIADREALDRVRIDVLADGEEIATGADPRDALGDLAQVLADLAALLATGGEALRAGDAIITGSAIPALALSGGERVEVHLDSSRVGVRIR